MKIVLVLIISLLPLHIFAAEKEYCYADKDFTREAVFVFTKSKCSNFSAHLPAGWEVSLGRKKGDRWLITDTKTKKHVGRFDCDLSNTDQKQLPEVLDKEMKLGNISVTKYTVTQEIVDAGQSATTVVSSLVTSYSFQNKGFAKLVLMSDIYDKASCLEESLEKVIKSIQIK